MNRVIERVLNLLAFLLTSSRPVTADEIRHTVAGYDQETDEAFRRTFERDKDELRALGVTIRTREIGDAEWACSNTHPSAANRSQNGVEISALPRKLMADALA